MQPLVYVPSCGKRKRRKKKQKQKLCSSYSVVLDLTPGTFWDTVYKRMSKPFLVIFLLDGSDVVLF